jgi:hypothetical protein
LLNEEKLSNSPLNIQDEAALEENLEDPFFNECLDELRVFIGE